PGRRGAWARGHPAGAGVGGGPARGAGGGDVRPIDGVMSPRVDGVISPRVDGREGAPADRAVATEFEAMMLRGMVEAMHRSARIADEEAGGQLVDHLIVDALADNLAKAGGIGLA